MLRLSAIPNKTLPEISQGHWEERRKFPSALRKRLLVYSDPNEFHMGADAWKLSLQEENADITKLHPLLSNLETEEGYLLPPNFQPWSQDGNSCSIPTWRGYHFNYWIDEKRIVKSDVEGYVHLLAWSPTDSRYVAVVRRHKPVHSLTGFISAPDGESLQLNARLLSDEAAHFWWSQNGRALIGLYRESKQSPPLVELFNPKTGDSLGKTSADPNKFIPYDAKKYGGVSRDHFSLVASPSTRTVGYFLDSWHNCYFDAKDNLISLSIYRPSGEPYVERQQILLPVTECWCTLKLQFEI